VRTSTTPSRGSAIPRSCGGEAIGDAGLLILDALRPIPDLGFRFAKSQWGRGLATEVAGAWLHLAFNEFGLERVSAFAHVENLRSLRVLEKVGFTRLERRDVMGMDSYTYRLMRPEFTPLRSDQPANMQNGTDAPDASVILSSRARGSFATLGATRYAVENARVVLAEQMAAPIRNVDTLTPFARAAMS
jgi:hypothetical protein